MKAETRDKLIKFGKESARDLLKIGKWLFLAVIAFLSMIFGASKKS